MMIRRFAFLSTILSVTLLASTSAFGWLSTGHRIVADITWAELTPPARTWAMDILKQHPRFQDDLLLNKPESLKDTDADHYAFASAATWPDMVRSQQNPMHALYNHPAWHFIDIPYAIQGTVATVRQPADAQGPQNIIQALTKNTADLKDAKVSPAEKAVALCWILHLCGDIHQPLHTCNLYSPQFPDGDQGGNLFIVLREPPYPDTKSNLHLIWDSLPGDYESRDIENYIASGLRADPKYSREKLKALVSITDFTAWANESHELAVKYAYVNGELRGVAKNVRLPAGTPTPGLTRDYRRDAETVADQRLILAGYRTADLLNAIFTTTAHQAQGK